MTFFWSTFSFTTWFMSQNNTFNMLLSNETLVLCFSRNPQIEFHSEFRTKFQSKSHISVKIQKIHCFSFSEAINLAYAERNIVWSHFLNELNVFQNVFSKQCLLFNCVPEFSHQASTVGIRPKHETKTTSNFVVIISKLTLTGFSTDDIRIKKLKQFHNH